MCRGCLFATLGATGGLAAAIVVRPALAVAFGALASAAAFALGSLWLRIPKVLSRLVPAALSAFALGGGALAAAIAIAGWAVCLAAYRRRGPDRSPCGTCAERVASVCSGFSPMVRRERAFQRLSGRWLRAAGL